MAEISSRLVLFLKAKQNNELFILGFAPTTWKIAHLWNHEKRKYELFPLYSPKLGIQLFNPEQHEQPSEGNHTRCNDEERFNLSP